jgi:hypothetical protein
VKGQGVDPDRVVVGMEELDEDEEDEPKSRSRNPLSMAIWASLNALWVGIRRRYEKRERINRRSFLYIDDVSGFLVER